MKTYIVVTLAMLTGIGVGAVAVQSLHAQGKPPTYIVIDVADYTEGFKAVTSSAVAQSATVTHGGHYVIRSEKMTALDGTPPKRFVVVAFDNEESARAWFGQPDVKALGDIRQKTTTSHAFLVEGFPN